MRSPFSQTKGQWFLTSSSNTSSGPLFPAGKPHDFSIRSRIAVLFPVNYLIKMSDRYYLSSNFPIALPPLKIIIQVILISHILFTFQAFFIKYIWLIINVAVDIWLTFSVPFDYPIFMEFKKMQGVLWLRI